MITRFVEVTNGPANWGKFLIAKFEVAEWGYASKVDTGRMLLRTIGQTPEARLIVDLQTGEGVIVKPGGLARADLTEHAVWVCPLFEPFLEWFYQHPETWDLGPALPALVDLPEAPFAMQGYRRAGPRDDAERATRRRHDAYLCPPTCPGRRQNAVNGKPGCAWHGPNRTRDGAQS